MPLSVLPKIVLFMHFYPRTFKFYTFFPDILDKFSSFSDPGYITTAICIVSSALVILQEKEKLPER